MTPVHPIPVVALIAAHGLSSADAGEPVRVPEHQWPTVINEVAAHGLAGLLSAAAGAGSVLLTQPQEEAATKLLRRESGRAVLLEAALVRTVELLDRAGIPLRVLKGAATARLAYPDPSWRLFTDVDVLVPGGAFDAAAKLLEQAGGERKFREARAGFDRRFTKAASFAFDDGAYVDLHRTLVLGPYGFTVDLEGLFERSSTFELAGRRLRALERHDAFVHACLHSVLGDWPPRLVPRRDVAQMLSNGTLRSEEVLERAASWRAHEVVAQAVRTADRLAPTSLDGDLLTWAATRRTTGREQRKIALYQHGRRSDRLALAAVGSVPGWRNKAAYVRALASPDGRYLDERDGSLLRRWRRAASLSQYRQG